MQLMLIISTAISLIVINPISPEQRQDGLDMYQSLNISDDPTRQAIKNEDLFIVNNSLQNLASQQLTLMYSRATWQKSFSKESGTG